MRWTTIIFSFLFSKVSTYTYGLAWMRWNLIAAHHEYVSHLSFLAFHRARVRERVYRDPMLNAPGRFASVTELI